MRQNRDRFRSGGGNHSYSTLIMMSLALVTSLGLAACGGSDGGGVADTSNGTATSNATSNGTTATSNGTTATSNGTTATSNGTTATSNGTTATSNGTTSTCSEDSDCLIGQICEESACLDGCREDDDCAQNEICLDLACTVRGVGCRDDEDCSGGQICEFESNTCVDDSGGCRADSSEPNELVGEAPDLDVGTLEELTVCASDNDYFAVAVTANRAITVTIDFDGADGDLNMQIVDGESAPILRAETEDGDTEQLIYTPETSGTVYVRVFGADSDVENSYTLTLAEGMVVEPTCDDDESEPNNGADEATALLSEDTVEGLISCFEDEDWFSFTTTANLAVTVDLTFLHDDGDLNVTVIDSDGVAELALSLSMTDNEQLTFNAPADGVYYIKIENITEESEAAYTLAVTGLVELTGCETNEECPEGQICENGVCGVEGGADGALRLSDGANARLGRVEIFAMGEWGTVCDDDFEVEDAQVVCRQLGFDGVVEFNTDVPGAETEVPTWLDNLACVGNEMSLLECENPGLGVENCTHAEDVGIVCLQNCETSDTCFNNEVCLEGACAIGECVTSEDCGANETCFNLDCRPIECENDDACEGQETCIDQICSFEEGSLRLVNSENDWEGRLEIYIMEQWGSVCDDSFGIEEANVVCRQLGFPGAIGTDDTIMGAEDEVPTWLDDLACVGDEMSLLECANPGIGVENCSHTEDIGVICQQPCEMSEECGEGQVCGDNGGCVIGDCTEDATCEEGNICLENNCIPGCRDTEDCTEGEVCDRLLCVPIECTGDDECAGERTCQNSLCEAFEGDIRLRGSENAWEGQLEVYAMDQWGSVCDDVFGLPDAEVVCRQLGFAGATAALQSTNHEFGQSPAGSPVWLDDMACVGDEMSLLECPNPGIGVVNCTHTEDVAVACQQPCTITEECGEDEVCDNGGCVVGTCVVDGECDFGSICEDNDCVEGCRDSFGCELDETCNFMMCIPRECSADDECDGERACLDGLCEAFEGDIRLRGSENPWEGQVQVYTMDQWGSVCDDAFGAEEADVICRQLGFPSAIAALQGINHDYGQSPAAAPTWLDDLDCVGDEMSLFDCPNPGIGEENCSHAEDAAVICQQPCEISEVCGEGQVCVEGGCVIGDCTENNECDVDEVCTLDLTCAARQCNFDNECEGERACLNGICEAFEGDLRLRGSENPWEGQLEVYAMDQWGSICDDLFTIEDAEVACRQLGFPGAVAALSGPQSEFGSSPPNAPTWLDNLECVGDEMSLLDCPNPGVGVEDCSHTEDAGIICQRPCVDNLSCLEGEVCDGGGCVIGNCVLDEECNGDEICESNFCEFGCREDLDCGDDEVCNNALCVDVECTIDDDCEGARVCEDSLCSAINGDLRLINGTNPRNGRLELLNEDQWGTVCDDSFGVEDGTVACRQLGFAGLVGVDITVDGAPADVPIWLDDLDCVGDEMSLLECPNPGLGEENCGHGEDIGLICLEGCEIDDDCVGEEVCTMGACLGSNCSDAFEPNNNRTEVGSLTFGDFTDLTLCGDYDREDWYQIDLEAAQAMIVTASFLHEDGNINLQLYSVDPEGGLTLQTSGTSTTDNEQVGIGALPDVGVTLLLRVFLLDGAEQSYSLNILQGPECSDDPFEDANDSTDTAPLAFDLLEGGVACVGDGEDADNDYYEIVPPIAEGQLVSVQAVTQDAFGLVGLEIVTVEDDVVTVVTAAPSGIEPVAIFAAAADTTYYARVFLSDGLSTTYDLITTYINCSDALEPNNNRGEATTLEGAGSFEMLTLCSNNGDAADWFVLSVAAAGSVSLAAIPNGPAQVSLDLLDASGVEIAQGEEQDDGSELLLFDSELGGVFYARVTATGTPRYTFEYSGVDGVPVDDCVLACESVIGCADNICDPNPITPGDCSAQCALDANFAGFYLNTSCASSNLAQCDSNTAVSDACSCDDISFTEGSCAAPNTVADLEYVSLTLPATFTGTSAGLPNNVVPVTPLASCGFAGSGAGAEAVFSVEFDTATTACVDTFGSVIDTTLYVQSTCGGEELICNDDAGLVGASELEFEFEANVPYYIIVDQFTFGIGAGGAYTLNLTEGPCAP